MPVTMGLVSAGIGVVGGGIQAIAGARQAKKARRELEGLQSPTYTQSKSISDYYNQALSRYQQSPSQSNLYKMQAQNIARGTAQGIAGLQDRRSALSGISGLIQGQNDAQLKALAAAEQDQSQKFGQLGAASQAMAGEERQAFNINQMMPYQNKRDILMQKAAGGAQLENAGLQNIYGGLQSGAMYGSGMIKDTNKTTENTYDQDRYLPPSTYKVNRLPY